MRLATSTIVTVRIKWFLSAFGDADRKGWSAASLTAKAIALSVLAV
ncbi:MAG: hypothetical protein V7L27_25355 [Nostoc sp.]